MASTATFGNANAGFQTGTINGNLQVSYHPPAERSRTPPPTAVIPFPHDPDFVERGTILEDVRNICAQPRSRVALVGLGGVGKSQLAIEYVYRVRAQSLETWVLWVYASNAARFEQSYRDIADRVQLAGRQDPQANILKLMHDWMCDSKHKWLLILDNVDDARFLLDVKPDNHDQAAGANPASKPLREYLPYCEHGSILVTTRNREAALKLVELHDIVLVQPMDSADAVALFEKKLGAQVDSDEVAGLAEVLEYMPLAIVQAAAFISRRSPRYSVASYLADYMKSERKRTSLLNFDEGQLRRDWEASNSIIVTWQISFEYIRQIRPSAAELLSLMSFFDRQGIPEDLLRSRRSTDNNASKLRPEAVNSDDKDDATQSSASDDESEDDGFEEDVVLLHDFSFISTDTNDTSFEMHALVQLSTQRWLAANDQLRHWEQQFISRLKEAFPATGEYQNWATCQALFAHAKAAAALKPKNESVLEEWACIMHSAAWYSLKKRNAGEAEQLALKCSNARKKTLGMEHEATLQSMVMLASTYEAQGCWTDAEKLQKQIVEISKTKLGEDHLLTTTGIGNLAATYSEQGRWDDAAGLQEQVLEKRRAKLGEDHLNTLTSMNNLALTYWKQGYLDNAARLQEQVLEKRRAKLGEDHPDTLVSLSNLALTYLDQGYWLDAAGLQERVLEIQRAKLGGDHPHTLVCMGNLAISYWKQGYLDHAVKLLEQVLEKHREKLGEDHPNTLTSMNNLACAWKDQNRDMDAIRLMSACVKLERRVLGVRHSGFISSQKFLAIWKAEQADKDLARTMEKAALGDDQTAE